MDLQLQGKRALVTGSSSGIGAGIARMLADEGVSVVVHGRNLQRLEAVRAGLAANGAQVAAAAGDLATDEGAASVADAALEAFGGIDILVNNAGGASEEAKKSWFDVDLDEWLSTYQKNVLAAGRLIHQLAPPMRERGWGRIIQIASAAGTIPTSAQPDYGPAKAAMINMSLGLSKALSGTGVTVNTVTPGMIMTEGLMDFLQAFSAKRGWEGTDQAAEYILKGCGQTVNRIGQVDDIAFAVTYLSSPRADFVNGVNMHLDGGGTSNTY
ncbi:MAG: SDR family NAD(P)-dependent oxidoreductase [Actinomycetota bacterium]|nr:SDR family NAD(P)-dependent oxidoreductase [Actinomycetota bacterium]